MSKLVDLIERVKTWPPQRQADVARLIETMEEMGTDIYHLTDEEREAVQEGLDSAFVSDEDLAKFRNRRKA